MVGVVMDRMVGSRRKNSRRSSNILRRSSSSSNNMKMKRRIMMMGKVSMERSSNKNSIQRSKMGIKMLIK